MNYPKGLISYTTEAKLAGEKTRWLRPKLIGYGLAMTVMSLAFVITLVTREVLQLDVIRDRSVLFVKRDDGMIQNNYTLKIINRDTVDHRMNLSVSGLTGITLMTDPSVSVLAGEVLNLPVMVTVKRDNVLQTTSEIHFEMVSEVDGEHPVKRDSRFFGPTH